MSDEQKAKSDLSTRTRQLAVRVIRLSTKLTKTLEARTIRNQVLRSGTAVGAHYCEAKRSRSPAEFISKVETALQELDETGYWLDLLAESGIVSPHMLAGLRDEVNQLTAMLVASAKTAKQRRAGTKDS